MCTLLTWPSALLAGGPLSLCDPTTQTPNAWGMGTIPVFTDPGTMGPNLSNADADARTADALAAWSGVATSYLDAAISGDIVEDVTLANVASYIGAFNAHGGLDVIYDADGTIISDFFGAPPGVLGIAGPEFFSGCEIIEAWAVMNGTAVDPSDTGGFEFGGVFTHEFGHSFNLAHSQTNGGIVFFGDDIGPQDCAQPYAGLPALADLETMYPFLSPGATGVDQASVNTPDDIASISNIHPTGGWPGSFFGIAGTMFGADGATPLTGVNIIARNVADPFADAISALSGDFTQGGAGSNADGEFTFIGLTDGANYVVYSDEIVDGGFSTTPAALTQPDQEEFHNGGSETGDSTTDDRCASTTVMPATTPTVANIILNEPGDSNEPNDDFASATPLICGDTGMGVISPVGDLDFFGFTVAEGFTVSFDIDTNPAESDLDSTLALKNSGGNNLATSDDDPAPGEGNSLDSYIRFGPLAAGDYAFAISSFGDTEVDGTDPQSSGPYSYEFICEAAPPAPGDLLGSTGNIGLELIDIDPVTGAGSFRAPQGALGPVTAIDFRSDGVLFGATGNNTSRLINIIPESGTEILLGTNPEGGAFNGLQFAWLDEGPDHAIVFAEDFEGDISGWTPTGLWHLTVDSACPTPVPGYTSPDSAFYFGQDNTCDYDNGSASTDTLTSPEITGITVYSVLHFQLLLETEFLPWDIAEVRIIDAAQEATTVWTRRDPTRARWINSGPIPLAAWAGETIQLQFWFDTLDNQFNNTLGWFVDDVMIKDVPEVEVLYSTWNKSGDSPRLVIVDQASARMGGGIPSPLGFAQPVGGLAVDPLSGTMYGAAFDTLITIDPVTGIGTGVGGFGTSPISALEFANDGTLFAGRGVDGQFMEIDTGTGTAMDIGPTGWDGLSGLSFAQCFDERLHYLFVQDDETYEACQNIYAGKGFLVVTPFQATLRAGNAIILLPGFGVDLGANLLMEIDPTLQP